MPAAPICGVHEATGVGPVLVTGQVVVVQALPEVPVAAVQVAGSTAVGPVFTVGQVVVVQLLPAVEPLATHEPEGVLVLLRLQLVVVQLLAAVAPDPVHDATG